MQFHDKNVTCCDTVSLVAPSEVRDVYFSPQIVSKQVSK